MIEPRTDIDDAETLLQRAVELVSTAKSMPLSSSVIVGRDELLTLLQDALERLPEDLRQSRWLLREREEYLERAHREADEILEAGRQRAERLVARTELVRQAEQKARHMVETANAEARRLRHEADDYCDQKLAAFEVVLERTGKAVAAGRAKLAVPVAAKEAEEEEANAAKPGYGKAKILEGSVFDQDVR